MNGPRASAQSPHFRICSVERTSGLKATGPSVARGGVVLPIDQDNRAQRDVVPPLGGASTTARASRQPGTAWGGTSTTTRA
ncbi:hypothetical protein PF005_g29740 [Phytophthora fragariae]|uniref:Uncharacterized protein n=1 Tax=Phytophthora fragariae TaxID=53985 RepID=A0A6A3Q1Y4_9STRA|nr:hypothetical protein PF003_g12589 [Phytophthora fragariae]KAE8963169.1 hypothetical protein PF011_g29138 [Phytophthora fragariae]KAE9061826.1 hypothetical protein PF010_g29667 [Phytophthora fragariae]KAE9066947.1 hypothetical protein PF007_g28257 [Phytophthora fragariae]KAE9165118.1 hypothetical protein PF005_g29740 [Phytophthora fragariae]